MSVWPIDQTYYWSPEWQAAERIAEVEITHGEAVTFTRVADAVRWLLTTVDPDFAEWTDADLPDVEDVEDEPPLIDNDPVPPEAPDPDAA